MDGQQQQTSPAPAPPGGRRNLLQQGGELVAAHGVGALVLIILLAAAVVFLYARQEGWAPGWRLWGGAPPRASGGEEKGQPGSAGGGDPEVDRLIDDINGAAPPKTRAPPQA
jgi:hypothetical protein